MGWHSLGKKRARSGGMSGTMSIALPRRLLPQITVPGQMQGTQFTIVPAVKEASRERSSGGTNSMKTPRIVLLSAAALSRVRSIPLRQSLQQVR